MNFSNNIFIVILKNTPFNSLKNVPMKKKERKLKSEIEENVLRTSSVPVLKYKNLKPDEIFFNTVNLTK